MNYLAAYEAHDKKGETWKGNIYFEASYLTKFVIDEVKSRQVRLLKDQGAPVDQNDIVITFISELAA